jgi:hypothetical protein
MGVKKLIVGTVYASDNEIQQKWLDLQLRYLKATTDDFDHVAVVSSGIANNFFEQRTKVIVPSDTTLHASEAHVNGLNMILAYFRDRAKVTKTSCFWTGTHFLFAKAG